MSITSSCQPDHHEVVGAREFTLENNLGCKALCFLGKVAVRGRR